MHTVTPLVSLEPLAEKCRFSCLFNAKFVTYLIPKEGEQGTSNDGCSMALSGSKAKLLAASNGATIAIVSKMYHGIFKTGGTAFVVRGVVVNLGASKGIFVRLDRTANSCGLVFESHYFNVVFFFFAAGAYLYLFVTNAKK